MRWAAVIGDPVEHSLSPAIHNRAYSDLGLDIEYRAITVSVTQGRKFLRNLPSDCVGLSVTMPLKQEIIPEIHYLDGLARVTGVVNTVVPGAGGLSGFNTDSYGIQTAVTETTGPDFTPKTVAILGGRATASSALAAATALHAERIEIYARSFSGAGSVASAAARMGVLPEYRPLNHKTAAQLAYADLIISTLPAGVADRYCVGLKTEAPILDAAYYPWPSKLAECSDNPIPGTRMLLHQAVAQIRLFTSRTPDVARMDEALSAQLGRRK